MNAWTQFLYVALSFFLSVNLSSEYIWPSYKSKHNPIPGEKLLSAWNRALSL